LIKRFLTFLIIALITTGCFSEDTGPTIKSEITRDPAHAKYLPDPILSPGDVFDVTKDDICVPGYATKVRDVPQSVKDQVYAEYGIVSHEPGAYEIDHIISLQLGGSNSIKNLYPEPYFGELNAHVKDKLENKLHSLVCSGDVDLVTVQYEIATDWVATYIKYIGPPE
jgi:hypothetical protein